MQQMRDQYVLGLSTCSVRRGRWGAQNSQLSSASVYGSGKQLEETAPLAPSAAFLMPARSGARERSERRVHRTRHRSPAFDIHLKAPMPRRFFARYALQRIYVAPRQPHPRNPVVHEEDLPQRSSTL